VYEDYFLHALDPYLPYADEWYANYSEHSFEHLGSYQIAEAPNGLMYRFNNNPKTSTVKGLQAFVFISISALNLPPARGGVRNMVSIIFKERQWLQYKDFRLALRQSLTSTSNSGMFVIIIPETVYQTLPIGRFVWVSAEQMNLLRRDHVAENLKRRIKSIIERMGS
jgi:hypothetical protein